MASSSDIGQNDVANMNFLVVRSADLQKQRSGTCRTSVAEEHLDVVFRVHHIETAAPPIGDTERAARDTFVMLLACS